MRLALAQINPTIGDLEGNAALIARFTALARDQRADLVVFPELALTGYPPRDLLMQEGFIAAASAAAKRLGEDSSSGLTLVFGVPLPLNSGAGGVSASQPHRLANALLAYRDGRLLAYYDKRLLPTYDVFDENRYFFPGEQPVVLDAAGYRVGLSICEDLWRGHDVGFADRYLDAPDPVDDLIAVGAQLIINPSASPFRLGVGAVQRGLLKHHAVTRGVYVAAVNQVGGNDELLFDGSACVYAPDGALIAAGPSFVEALTVVELPRVPPVTGSAVTGASVATGTLSTGHGQSTVAGGTRTSIKDPLASLEPEEALFRALAMGVKDYCRKTGFKTAVLGLSGGIDSAVVAVLAAAALGPGAVHGVALPSKYSSPGSKTDAAKIAANLGVHFQTIPIEQGVAALESTLAPAFTGKTPDVTEENLQSRLRGTILMALSNKFGHILLTTGNKSEMAVGYATLYGDMNGGLAVISDVTKTLVYKLARWMNDHWERMGIVGLGGPPIPVDSITKPPSAELRPNQTDQDSLPPYDVLDEIVDRYVTGRQSPQRIVAEMSVPGATVKTDAATVKRVVRLIDLAEYKRKQAAVGLKVTGVAFGSGRRVPIAQGYRPERGLA